MYEYFDIFKSCSSQYAAVMNAADDFDIDEWEKPRLLNSVSEPAHVTMQI